MEHLKGQIEWRLIQSTRQLLVTWFFSTLAWFAYVNQTRSSFFSNLTPSSGAGKQMLWIPWVWSSEPYLLLLVSAWSCVFLSLWRCKGSMVGHTSAHKPVCIHPCRHTHMHSCTHTHTHTNKGTLTQLRATKKPKITGTCCSNHNVYNEAKLERFLGNSNFNHKPQQRPKKQQHLNNAAM